MADQAVLIHRSMLPHKRASFFGVAFVAEVVDRVGSQHLIGTGPAGTAKTNYRLRTETAHGIVAAGAFERLSSDKCLLHWMMGLFVCLGPDIPMTVEAQVRLGGHEQLFHSFVDGMAAITRVSRKHVPVHIPERQCL
jgi:hypothetical protein